MVNAAKGFLYLQSGTAHVETINEVGDDKNHEKTKALWSVVIIVTWSVTLPQSAGKGRPIKLRIEGKEEETREFILEVTDQGIIS